MKQMDYLDRPRKVKGKKKSKFISPPGNIAFERKEFLITKFVAMYLVPMNRPSLAHCAKELRVGVQTLMEWRKTELYQKVCAEMRAELRSKWRAEIDRVVMRKALKGNGFFCQLYYKLEGELLDRSKIEITRPDAIPDDPEELKKEINQLALEVGAMKNKEKNDGNHEKRIKRKEP